MNLHTHHRPGRMLVALALSLLTVALLFLALGLAQQPAYSQDLPSLEAVGNASLAAASQVASTPCPTDPPTGKKAKIVSDDEILLTYRFADSSRYLQNQVIDNPPNSLDLVVDPARYKLFSLGNLDEVGWLAGAAADLNGNGHAELVSAFQNHAKQIGAIANPFNTTAAINDWYNSSDRTAGDGVDAVGVAAGNLDRKDNNDELAVAFRDDNGDIHVSVLDGDKAGTGIIGNADNAQSSDIFFDANERGDVHHVAVATGDLNGDGYDDEIVTAFKDSGSDLQVVILRHQNESATLKEIWHMDSRDNGRDNVADDCSMWHNRKPLAVTTGDVDGDLKDEVILAFRIGHCDNGQIQLLLLDVTGEDLGTQALTVDTRVWKNFIGPNYYAQAYNNVSVAAGDLDGDGVDEIAVGANTIWAGSDHDDRHWQQLLMTFEYVPFETPDYMTKCSGELPGCLYTRPGTWTSGSKTMGDIFVDENKREAQINVSAGDLDQDGMDEIALARYNKDTGDPQVLAFDANASLALRKTLSIDTGSNSVWEFWLDVGDEDGDSQVAEYTGKCYSKQEARVLSVIHAPPHGPDTGCDWTHPLDPECEWEENYTEAEAAFGTEKSSTVGYSTGATTMIGSEVTLKAQVHEIGPSFTYEWEKSVSAESTTITNTAHGSGFETRPAWVYYDEASNSALEFIRTEYDCYVYHEATYGDMDVCLPIISGDAAYTLEGWYSDEEGGGRATYPDSWVPVGINLAQGSAGSQSSEDTTARGAGLALDGNTNGDYYGGSVATTGYSAKPWWQVDLGGVQQIDGVQIWNRTDAFSERLSNFYVFMSHEPFTSNDPNVLAADPHVWHHTVSGAAGKTTTIPVDEYGRYLRVQLTGQNYLQLAEVQVWGTPGEPKLWPSAKPASSNTEKFTLTWPGNRKQEVQGQLLYTWPSDATNKYVGKGVYGTEFDIGLGQEGETISGGSTSNTAKLGMEIKYVDASVSYGVEKETSYILGWSNEVNFNGKVGGLPHSAPYEYYYAPYVWLQRATSSGGVGQAFFVLDYWLPSTIPATSTAGEPGVMGPQNSPAITPTVPLLNSPTHPDPATWVGTNTATFTWTQPPGDPAILSGYTWELDRTADTAPRGFNLGPTTTKTYTGLADGLYYMHVRAVSDGGQWSDTAHRAIRVDVTPPTVQLTLDPGQPNGHNGWYVTPVTVTASAADGAGAGVAGIEVSTDGVAWQPYNAPLAFNADTAGATVYARATDAAGHISAPISTTFKIDQTPPDSHVAGGAGPGAWVARVITNAADNEVLVMAGAVHDTGSGRSGMSIEYDGLDWTGTTAFASWPGQPALQVNWVFTATHEIGAGNHIFFGRAQDVAGNEEAPYEIARVLWYPEASPDIAGSSLTASPTAIRPGEVVTLTVVARNAGWQEAHVTVVDTLPAGLTPITPTLGAGVKYDPTTRTVTWPAQLLWPGQSVQHTFQAQAAADLPAVTLENRATLHAFWPNTDLLPPVERQRFLDHEQTVTVTAGVTVNPSLPAGSDLTPPWVRLGRGYQAGIVGSQVRLDIAAAPDARWMFLRAWSPDPTTGAWTVAQSSGWINYTDTYTWTLSAGQGVRYLGVWVADQAHNVSTLDERSLVFVNRIDGNQTLANGQRVQYRGDIGQGTWLVAALKTVSGDPDMYAWKPRNGFRPDQYSNDTVLPGQTEELGHRFTPESGRYLLEVQAVGASEYQLTMPGGGQAMAEAAYAPLAKQRPAHPLVVSDPLSAGQVGPVDTLRPKIYLPLMFRNN
jgi:uncharacterized repeat protein (TIGR01451 family)